MSTLSENEKSVRPEIVAMGGEVVWQLPGNYLRMSPIAAINLASQLIQAAKETTA